MSFTYKKFKRLGPHLRHKHAAGLLRSMWDEYRKMEGWLELNEMPSDDLDALSARYHLHLNKAHLNLREHHLLPAIHNKDHPSDEPFLPIAIYLNDLRSAYNVGSIIRTTEAMRLGTIYLSENSPSLDNPKIEKTSMGGNHFVPSFQGVDLAKLPGPIIGLDTAKEAPHIHDFEFPETFTLVLGNEELGISSIAQEQIDQIVQVPLCGVKNSLNVACAFSIAASVIRSQYPATTPHLV